MLNDLVNNPQKLLTAVSMVAAFGLVLSIWLAGVIIWANRRAKKAKRFQERLRAIESPEMAAQGRTLRLWHEGKETTTIVPESFQRSGMGAYFEDLRVQAGFQTPVASGLLSLTCVLAIASVAGYMLSGNVLMAFGAPIAVLIVFWIVVQQRISKRTTHFERNLIDALELAARSLRAGHPLVGSFQMIAEEIPAPVGDLFGQVCQQQNLGVPMEEALRSIAEEHPSDDLKLFSTSVVIQIRSGGNLADMMMRLANVIRERNRLARRIRVLTAQTQFSKRVLLALPFLVFVLLNILNPVYMDPLYHTFPGQMIMAASAIGLLVGWMMMNWLSKLTP